jgi:CRISP-associated protein Cas1
MLALNTLYVTSEKSYLAVEGESLVVRVDKMTKLQVPLHHLASVVCMVPATMSGEAMHACASRGTSVIFLDAIGRFLARVEGPAPRTATLRQAQYKLGNDVEGRLAFARCFVAGKVANQRTQLRRAGRTRISMAVDVEAICQRLTSLGERAVDCEAADRLLGIEGEAAALYFSAFDCMLENADFSFERRTRRPPLDPVNCLLSFGYALLASDCLAALEGVGLDPCVGLMHAERSGRPALALDLMEELRTPIVDRLVLALIRLGQVRLTDFEFLPTGEVRMSTSARKTYLVEYQKRKKETITHPSTGQEATWAHIPHLQARILARAIRGEYEYAPMVIR